MRVFLCRAAGVEGVAVEMSGRRLLTLWAPGDGSTKFTFLNASNDLDRRFCLASHFPEPQTMQGTEEASPPSHSRGCS